MNSLGKINRKVKMKRTPLTKKINNLNLIQILFHKQMFRQEQNNKEKMLCCKIKLSLRLIKNNKNDKSLTKTSIQNY